MTARQLEGVAVVFVNHHSESLIAPKLPALVAAGAHVLVVDNSGTFPARTGAAVVDPGANLGFAGGCNVALEQLGTRCPTICFQNPDLDAEPEVVAGLQRRLHQQRRPGLVTPAIRIGGVIRRNGYAYPSPSRELAVGLRAIAGLRGGAGTTRRPSSEVRDVVGRGRRFGSGGLLLGSREALTAVGGFDEDYFLYAEDLDLWHRVSAQGFSVAIDPDVVVDHDEGTGGRMAGADRELLRWLGVELFAQRTGAGRWQHFRTAHRALLPLLAGQGGRLAPAVHQAWARGASPVEVQREVRAVLAAARAA